MPTGARGIWPPNFFENLNQKSGFFNKDFFKFLSDSESFIQKYLKMAEK